MKTATITLRLSENAATVASLSARRDALLALPVLENVWAGVENGQSAINEAIRMLNVQIAKVISIDLTEGRIAYA